MRLQHLALSPEDHEGLQGRFMRLGARVFLAGPNGSGKTRVLRAVANAPGISAVWLDTSSSNAIEDPARFTSAELENRFRAAENLGFSNVSDSALAIVQVLQNRWFNTSHDTFRWREGSVAKEAEQAYFKLCDLIEQLLGARPERDGDGQVTFFGRNPVSTLSPGQVSLLRFAVGLHCQSQHLGELTILIEEPENYLHPSASRALIERLQKANPNGQLWIATHSVNVLADAEADEIWFVQNSKVAFAGKMPEQVLTSLLGDSDQIRRIADFCGRPAQLATTRFAAECLLAPQSVPGRADDPQPKQIQALLEKHGRPLRVLDIGAGKGRLLNAYDDDQKDTVRARLDYFATEFSDQSAPLCVQSVSRFYDGAEKRVFRTKAGWDLERHSVDVVVLCNVLHEIPPKEWEELFHSLKQYLKPDASILVAEDYLLSMGELAHPFGFLLLDEEELRALFGWQEGDPQIVTDSDNKNRVKAHLFPVNFGRVSRGTCRAAITCLRKRALEKIKACRAAAGANGSGGSSYADGREHALWVQLYANAALALTDLSD